jgi:hypothetical protein
MASLASLRNIQFSVRILSDIRGFRKSMGRYRKPLHMILDRHTSVTYNAGAHDGHTSIPWVTVVMVMG